MAINQEDVAILEEEMVAISEEAMDEVAKITAQKGSDPERPPFWGGWRITPVEIEFWADGAFRLHDRFVWRRQSEGESWQISRLNP